MEVTVIFKNGGTKQLERIHLYGSMAVPDFVSFFQREEDFDPESPMATRGFHFLKREVSSFETKSDEVDIEQTRKRLDSEKEEEEKRAWDLRELGNLQN